MKKAMSLLLVLALLLGLCSFAMAEDVPTVTIALGLNTNVVDYDTNAYTLALEKEFGVNVEFMLMEDITQKLPVMVSSGSELPDMICTTLDNNLVWNWAQQGVLLPLTEYWNNPELTKDLYGRVADLECDPALVDEMLANVTMPDGEIYTLPSYDQNFWNLSVLHMRLNMDWLNAAGIEVPKTLDEFKAMLVYFRDHDMNGNGDATDEVPLTGQIGSGYQPWAWLMNAFIHTNPKTNFINVENGTVVPAYTQDAFKAGLAYVHEMYEEGLIDPLSFTQDMTQLKAVLATDPLTVGAVCDYSDSALTTDATKAAFTIVGPVSGPEGVCLADAISPSVLGRVYITCDAKDPELCFRMAEINYGTIWRTIFRNGVEGENWTRDPEEIRQYKLNFLSGDYSKVKYALTNSVWGKLTNNIWNSEVMPFFATQEGIINQALTTKVADLTEEELNTPGTQEQHYNLYYDFQPAEKLGSLIYTTEELERLSEIQAAIDSYAKEEIVGFITGNVSLDDWDNFQNELKKMGLEDYVAIMQAAYDRKTK